MKKIVCLLMVAMLALSLSIAVFARYEPCPCGGKATYGTLEEPTGKSHSCGRGSHPLFVKKTGYYCSNCEEFSWTNPKVSNPYCYCDCNSCS